MPTEVFLHIGRHKTGTTALQTYLAANRERLAEQGVLYPETGRQGVGHHRIADALNPHFRDPDVYADLKTAFDQEVAGWHYVILSSEAFQNIKKGHHLSAFFGEYPVHTICYFREALEYAQSAYAQVVHARGYTKTFKQFIRKDFRPAYAECAKLFENLSNTCHFRLLERERLVNRDVVSDFLNIVGLHATGYTPRNFNVSIGGNLLYMKWLVNCAGFHDPCIYWPLANLALERKAFSSGFSLPPRLQKEVRAHFAHENRFLETRFGSITYRDFGDQPACPNLEHLPADIALMRDALAESENDRVQTWVKAFEHNAAATWLADRSADHGPLADCRHSAIKNLYRPDHVDQR